MYLPSVTRSLLNDTINELWEIGAELNNSLRMGEYADDAAMEQDIVAHLSALATYINSLHIALGKDS